MRINGSTCPSNRLNSFGGGRRPRVLGAREQPGSTARKLLRLMDALEENDDVQDVYANFDIPEGILEAVA